LGLGIALLKSYVVTYLTARYDDDVRMVNRAKLSFLKALTLSLACVALIAHEQIELLTDHDDCEETVCMVCGGHGGDAAALLPQLMQVAFVIVAASRRFVPFSGPVSGRHLFQPSRAPPANW
jgi:hypothetical protein